MRPLHRSGPVLACASLAFAGMGGVGFVPLFAGPGYESALAAGLLLPGLAAAGAAVDVSDQPPVPSAGFARGLEIGAILATIGYVTTLVHGARSGFCDAATGTAMFVLGPAMGALLGGVWGAAMGEVAGRIRSTRASRALALVLALAGPAAGVLVSLWRFWSSPMVFAYDPFFGFFSGALYDTVVTDTLADLLTYRAGTLATLLAAGAASAAFMRGPKGGFELSAQRHPGVLWLAVASSAASLAHTAEGARLGHWQTSESVAEQLGGHVLDERCELFHPRSLTEEEAQLALRDCATQARQVIAFFELDSAPQVRVFLFGSAAERRRLMGASETSMAKPWRRELYVQAAGYPHPAIAHEMAHVLAGERARGPFRIAGGLGGWWPNPGLIEGMAVAAAPDDDVLTPQQWAAAMHRLGILPPLSRVFALGFFGENAAKAYTVAGAFVGWLRDTLGSSVALRWYAGEPLERAAGRSLEQLEQEWRAALAAIPVDDAALAHARSRFDRPAIFARRCPHAVDALTASGEALAVDGDCVGAAMAFGRASLLDPRHPQARLGLASCLPRLSGPSAARQQWGEIAADAALPPAVRDRALESLADLMLVSGDGPKAATLYEELVGRAVLEDRARTLEIKAHAAREARETRAIGELLVGTASRRANPKLAYAMLGQWMAEVSDDGLPAYLIGRNLAHDGLWRESAEYLDEALRRRLPSARVMRELLRTRIVVACAQRDEETARPLFARLRADPRLPAVRRVVLERRLGACISPGAGRQ